MRRVGSLEYKQEVLTPLRSAREKYRELMETSSKNWDRAFHALAIGYHDAAQASDALWRKLEVPRRMHRWWWMASSWLYAYCAMRNSDACAVELKKVCGPASVWTPEMALIRAEILSKFWWRRKGAYVCLKEAINRNPVSSMLARLILTQAGMLIADQTNNFDLLRRLATNAEKQTNRLDKVREAEILDECQQIYMYIVDQSEQQTKQDLESRDRLKRKVITLQYIHKIS